MSNSKMNDDKVLIAENNKGKYATYRLHSLGLDENATNEVTMARDKNGAFADSVDIRVKNEDGSMASMVVPLAALKAMVEAVDRERIKMYSVTTVDGADKENGMFASLREADDARDSKNEGIIEWTMTGTFDGYLGDGIMKRF